MMKMEEEEEEEGGEAVCERKKPRKRKHKKKSKKESTGGLEPQKLPAGTIPTTLNSYGTVKGGTTPNIIAANQITFSEQVKKGLFKPEERKRGKKYSKRSTTYDSMPEGYFPDIVSSPFMDPYLNYQMQDIMATAASVYQQQQAYYPQQPQPYASLPQAPPRFEPGLYEPGQPPRFEPGQPQFAVPNFAIPVQKPADL